MLFAGLERLKFIRGGKIMPIEWDVRISPIVTKQLKLLSRGGGNAARAGEHARTIMAGMSEGISSLKQIGRLTRYGEARIPNCMKFDLVGGFRLIGVLGKREILFIFVGSHDECDNWIKNNANPNPVFRTETGKIAVFGSHTGRNEGVPSDRHEHDGYMEPDYMADILDSLTDRDLRNIFGGICGQGA